MLAGLVVVDIPLQLPCHFKWTELKPIHQGNQGNIWSLDELFAHSSQVIDIFGRNDGQVDVSVLRLR